MSRQFLTGSIAILTGVACLGLVGVLAHGQYQARQPTPQPPPPVDVGKYKVELPTKHILAGASAPAKAATTAADNPTVEPGKVRWHPTFEAACQAAQKSGKPVLLFQMLGRLDQQFC